MSLINQMLRDLEARQAAETGDNGSVFRGLATGAAPRRRSPFAIAALIVVAMALAGAAAWFWSGRRHQPAPKVAATTPPPRTPAPASRPVRIASAAVTSIAEAAPTSTAVPRHPAQPQRQPHPPTPTPTPHVKTASHTVRQPAPPPAPAPHARRISPAAHPATAVAAARTKPQAEDQLEIHRHPQTPQQQAIVRYQEALALLREHRNDEAEGKLREALHLDPANGDAAEALGVLLINEGRTVEAAPIIDAARRLHKQQPMLELLAARIRLAQGDVAGATALLEKGLPFSGQTPEYVALLAALYQKQKRYDDSVRAYQRAIVLDPSVGAWWVGLGISEEGAGNSHDAVSAYTRALRRNLTPALHSYAQQRLDALQPQSPASGGSSDGLN